MTSGGSKGGRRGRAPPPPGGQNVFIFMQFSAKIDKIIGWRPPGSWRPLLGEILDPPLVTFFNVNQDHRTGSPGAASHILNNLVKVLCRQRSKNVGKYSIDENLNIGCLIRR